MAMENVKAYAAFNNKDPLGPYIIKRRGLLPRDVLIQIHYCGICHSDISHITEEWTKEVYPLVPGHEITGVVSAIGPEVTRHKVGDRVGVGCLVDTCRECKACKSGQVSYCSKGATLTYATAPDPHGAGPVTYGGYSSHIVVDSDFVFKIPDGLELAEAAPLLCAGITCYAPLVNYKCGPGKKVAIVGLGGLGHVGVKLAKAMGAEVTVISQSMKKQQAAKELGADDYAATSDPETFKKYADTFDIIVNTVSAPIDLDGFLGMLAFDGAMCNVGAPPEPMPVRLISVLRNRRIFTGSMIGTNEETQDMLDFCGKHKLGADIEIIGVDKINEAYKRILASDVKYRFVIDISTLGK